MRRLWIVLSWLAGLALVICALWRVSRLLNPAISDPVQFVTGNILNALIFGAIVVQAYIYQKQRAAMTEQLEIERAKTNPRLRVSKIRIENFEVGQSPVFITTIANDGFIDATGVELNIGIKFGYDREFNWIKPQTVLIPARGKESYPITSGAFFNEEEFAGFNTNIPIEVAVGVKYWPGSPTEPQQFCYRYLPWRGKRPDDIPEFVPCDFNPGLNIGIKIQGAQLKLSDGVTLVQQRAAPKPENRDESGKEDGEKGKPN